MPRYLSDSQAEEPDKENQSLLNEKRGQERVYHLAEVNISVDEALRIISSGKIWSKLSAISQLVRVLFTIKLKFKNISSVKLYV